MFNLLTRNLASVFRDRANLTSVKRLKKEGIRTVSVLDLAQLEEIVGTAIERVLRASSPSGLSSTQLAADVQLEFLKMLGQKDDLERTNQELQEERQALQTNLSALNSALETAQRELADSVEQQDREVVTELASEWEATLTHLLGNTAESLRDGPDRNAILALHRPLSEGLQRALTSALRRASGDPGGDGDGGKVQLLERRVRKLSDNLEEAETMLRRLRENREAVSTGVSSIYKDVQGIGDNEDHAAERRKLMREIFQLNLELRKAIDE